MQSYAVPLPHCRIGGADARQFGLIEPKWQVQRIKALVGEQAVQANGAMRQENSKAPAASDHVKQETRRSSG